MQTRKKLGEKSESSLENSTQIFEKDLKLNLVNHSEYSNISPCMVSMNEIGTSML